MSFNRTTLAVIGFMAVAGYFLWTEHSAHVVHARVIRACLAAVARAATGKKGEEVKYDQQGYRGLQYDQHGLHRGQLVS